LKGGSCIRVLSGHSAQVRALCMNDTRLVSGCADRIVRLWEVQKNACVKEFTGHSDTVSSVCCVHGWIFSASLDGTVRQWDPESGACMNVIKGGSDGDAVCVATDGKILYVGTQGGSCHRYRVSHLLVGAQVEMWRINDARWFPGDLKSYCEDIDKYILEYDEGMLEEVTLPSQLIRLAIGEDLSVGPLLDKKLPGLGVAVRAKSAQAEAIGGSTDHSDGMTTRLMLDPDLPEGWTVEERKRTNSMSKTVKRVDKYYIAPTGRTFRSKLEVMRFLETGEVSREHKLPRKGDDTDLEHPAKKVSRGHKPPGVLVQDRWGQDASTPHEGRMSPETAASFEHLGSELLGVSPGAGAPVAPLRLNVDGQEWGIGRTPTSSGRKPKTPTHLLQ